MKRLLHPVCIILCLLSSCISSPQARIDQEREQFKRYSAHEQYLIRKGQIEVGFDQEQVRMAWGDPQKHRQDTTAKGTSLVWEYTELRPRIGAFSSATIKRGLDAGVHVHGSPTQTKLLGRVFFNPQTGKVARFQTFN